MFVESLFVNKGDRLPLMAGDAFKTPEKTGDPACEGFLERAVWLDRFEER